MRDLPAGRFTTAHGLVVLVPIDETAQIVVRDDERPLAATYAERRLRTFAAGRAALRAALEQDVHIGRTDRGAPVLPGGWLGSITHKDELAGALVRRADPGVDETLGVDLEVARDPRAATRDISSHVLLPAEIAALAHLDEVARAREVLARFSLKEAYYKAIDPRVRRFVGFHEVSVAIAADGTATIDAPFFGVAAPRAEGLVIWRNDVVITSVVVRW